MSKKTVAFKTVPKTPDEWVRAVEGPAAIERAGPVATVVAEAPAPEAEVPAPKASPVAEPVAPQPVAVVRAEDMKRFTIDVPESLHRRIKMQCAMRGVKMADVLRELMEKEFPA